MAINASARQSAPNARRYVLAAVVLIMLIQCGRLAYQKYQRAQAAAPPAIVTTWAGVPSVLDSAVGSVQYKTGAKYIADPSQLAGATDAEKIAHSYHLGIDFLRSLSPAQVASLKQGHPVPYNDLNPAQKQALFALARTRDPRFARPDAYLAESRIAIVSTGTESYVLDWYRFEGHLEDSMFYMDLSRRPTEFVPPATAP